MAYTDLCINDNFEITGVPPGHRITDYPADRKILGIPLFLIPRSIEVDAPLVIKKSELHRVAYDFPMNAGWYAKGYLRAFIARSIFWFMDNFYWRFLLCGLLYRRLHLIQLIPSEIFTWRRCFKPLIWLNERRNK